MCFPAIGAAMLGYTGAGSVAAATAATGLTSTGLGIMGATTALGIASPVVGAIGQRQQAKTQMALQAQQRQAAIQKQGLQRTSALLEAQQKSESIALRKQQLLMMREAARGTLRAKQGVAISDAFERDLDRQLGVDLSMLEEEEGLYGIQYGLGMQELGLAGQQELLKYSQPVQAESPLVTSFRAISGGLSGASAGLGLASAGRKRKDVSIGGKSVG
jgi:hypothetical protein